MIRGKVIKRKILFAPILRNLLTNAVKYSPEGGTIVIKGQQNKGELLVQVSDQGIGVAPTEQEKIFERWINRR